MRGFWCFRFFWVDGDGGRGFVVRVFGEVGGLIGKYVNYSIYRIGFIKLSDGELVSEIYVFGRGYRG